MAPQLTVPGTRHRARTGRWLRIMVGAGALGLVWCVLADDVESALVVEAVGRGSAAARAELAPGDVLLEWRRQTGPSTDGAPASGRLASPFDLEYVEIEQAPRGPIELSARRGDTRLAVQMPGGEWGIEIRPAMDEGALELYQQGTRARAAADSRAAAAAWTALAARLERDGDRHNAAWLWARLGEIDPASEEAGSHFAKALAVAKALEPPVAAMLWELRARALEAAADAGQAEQAWREAIRLRESIQPDSLPLANDLYMLGTLKGRSGDLELAADLLSQSLEMRRRLAPGSLQEAEGLTALGISAAIRGDLDLAAERFEQALTIAQQNDPDAGQVAAALNALGNVAQRRGELVGAQRYYHQALQINEKLDPAGLNAAFQLNNLGFIAELRGDLATAEDFYRRSLAIKQAQAPGTIHVARAIDNLAFVAFARGDLAGADDLHREALTLYQQLAPGSLVVSTSLKLLGRVKLEQGELDEAGKYLERARELEHGVAPTTLSYAEILDGLGRVADKRDDTEGARALYAQALALRTQVAPSSLDVAESLERLGQLAMRQRDLDTAERHYQTAVTIRSRLAPGTAAEAEALHALGSLFRHTDRKARAREYYDAALDALESQRGKLGGTDEVRTRFAARYGHLYKDYIDLLIELGEPGAAFDVLERYRARGLLAMLAERDLLLDRDLPGDIAERRSAINREYDQITTGLQRLDDTPERAHEIEALLARLRSLRAERQQLADRIRAVSPRLAAAESPRPLGLEEVYRTLDPGTALLSYSVGATRTWLFAVRRGEAELPDLRVISIGLGEEALGTEVAAMRLLIQVPDAGEASERALTARAHALYRQLLEPVRELVADSERLLIVPDGPLHLLAFSALVVQPAPAEGAAARPRYLIEERPVHTAVSATVYAELRKQQERPAGPASSTRLVAFADPIGPESVDRGSSDDLPDTDSARGEQLGVLPYARREVRSIADLYEGSAQLYFGEAASEERAKSIGPEPRFIHFASHGVADARFPLDSYLVLSPSAAAEQPPDNGLLQAWEIFEQMRVDADLVTLSACDTGIGAGGGGEGLIGLTRAFQYAGARAVLASLWPISDRSTSLLMTHFYRNLTRGMPKDEALRMAQLELIEHDDDTGLWARLRALVASDESGVDLSHPFHWAAFQLIGDPGSPQPGASF